MNRQGKVVKVNGLDKVVRGIEWTKSRLPDGNEYPGYTWNVIGGCLHECKWEMPDGEIARCYAKDVALGVASQAYSKGFEYHYWNPDKLEEPLGVKRPSRIFLDSMSDLMGHWVPDEQINQVFSICRRASWHSFQLLTKNPKRLLEFALPDNLWAGFSTPPDFMWGKRLSPEQKDRKLEVDLEIMKRVKARVRWASVEPLSWDVSGHFEDCSLDWVVIGAASNGKQKYQPDREHLLRLLDILDQQEIPVFFKGNLEWDPWREEFPEKVSMSYLLD